MLESKFKTKLIKDITTMFPEAIVLHNNAGLIQGFPDLLILNQNKWAALEGKKHSKAKHQKNQDHYVDKLCSMSYAAFIYPENKKEVLDELQRALST